ncbi:hypothetical protein ACX0KY_16255 [Pseudomonas extremorientalis]|uniref:Uncharacterized protein n=1 Tax=Pseudomonas allii TaxID=2740531 RepID=A0ACC6LM90_9PSED|nr:MULTISPECIES: hypothetical protein [Pseudomonas]MDR9879186.1 hypothetical protein [Pseudomonas allii]
MSKPNTSFVNQFKENNMRSLLLWFLGVPIPVIILIAIFMH